MFCTECGKQLVPAATACHACGASVDAALLTQASENASQPATPEPPPAPAPPVSAPATAVAPRQPASSPRTAPTISFGNWQVGAKSVEGPGGVIPLDQVSCCVFAAEPMNKRNVAIGAIIVLGGLYGMTQSAMTGLIVLAIGGIILYLALQTKRAYQLYSSSGYCFDQMSQQMDMGGDRDREFAAFTDALLEQRHAYLTSLAG